MLGQICDQVVCNTGKQPKALFVQNVLFHECVTNNLVTNGSIWIPLRLTMHYSELFKRVIRGCSTNKGNDRRW